MAITALQNRYSRLASEWASLSAAVTAIGATPTTLILPAGWTDTLTGNLTLPTTLRTEWRGGIVDVNGFTLTIAGPFYAPAIQCFDTSVALSSVVFTNGPRDLDFLLEWWGGGQSVASADVRAWGAAFAAADQAGRVRFVGRDYYLDAEVIVTGNNTGIEIVGPSTYSAAGQHCVIHLTAAGARIRVSARESRAHGFVVDGGDVATNCIVFQDAQFGQWQVKTINAVGDGVVLDTEMGAAGGNLNYLKLGGQHRNHGGWGIGTPTRRTEINALEITAECHGNAAGGMLVKGGGWRILMGGYEENGGPGMQFGEDGDASSTYYAWILGPHIEGNTGGQAVVFSLMADNNVLWMDPGSDAVVDNSGKNTWIRQGAVTLDGAAADGYIIGTPARSVAIASDPSTAHVWVQPHGIDADIALVLAGKGAYGVQVGDKDGWFLKGCLVGQATWDPPSIAFGAGGNFTSVTVPGAELGDMVQVSFSRDLEGTMLYGYITAANAVGVIHSNPYAGTVNLLSGELRVMVWDIT